MVASAMTISPTHRLIRSGSGLLIELQKPKTLNALDLEAFLELDRLLDRAERDPEIRFIVIWAPPSVSPRAFCAGGDVRRLYDEHQKSGTLDHGARFFASEYRVDQRIWNFCKPVIALTHGITMGGGIGLIRGAGVRVACETSIWAMPEISIGLYPDVGATYFLSQLPDAWAAFLALTGARLTLADIVHLGLATHSCRQEDLSKIIEGLDQGLSIESLLAACSITPSTPSWIQNWPQIENLFGALDLDRSRQAATAARLWHDADRIRKDPRASPGLEEALGTLLSGSPASVRLILEQLRVGRLIRQSGSVGVRAAFEWETEASLHCMAYGDFFEGVRSRLVEKDFREPGRPLWKHRSPGDLSEAEVNALFPSVIPS